MPRYQGGKSRLGAKIARVILSVENLIGYKVTGKENLQYLEPFVGFCGVLIHIAPGRKNITACDGNPDIPELWRSIQKGWIPPNTCSNEHRQKLRDGKSCPEKTLFGFGTSFNGSWFLGKSILRSGNRDPASEATRGAIRVGKSIENVRFLNGRSYHLFSPVGRLVYCDPPYRKNNYGQSFFRGFDSDKFWEIMDKWVEQDNIVIVSESSAPKHWKSIWNSEMSVNVRWKSPKGGKARTCAHKNFSENLYIHRNHYELISRGARSKIAHI